MDRTLFDVACVAALASVAGLAGAQPGIHQGDISLGIAGDRLAVGDGSRDATGALVFDECAFGVELDLNARSPDPGFDTELGTFSPSSAIAYAHRAALRRWNGQDFDSIPAETMRMSFGPLQGVSTPPVDPAEPIVGPFVGVNSQGEYHNHFTFRLELNGSPATGPQSAGVFLAELQLQIDDGSLLPTEPFWLVIDNGGDSADFEDALAFARNTIGGCGEAPACVVDVNGNGQADPGDFTAWIAAYNIGDPVADQNGDGLVNPGDFTAWVANYNIGCP